MPKSELAVVVLVVCVLLGSRVAYPLDGADLPAGSGEGVAFVGGDGAIYEQYEVALCAGSDEALGEGYGSADIGFRGMKNCNVGFSFWCLCRALNLGDVEDFPYPCESIPNNCINFGSMNNMQY